MTESPMVGYAPRAILLARIARHRGKGPFMSGSKHSAKRLRRGCGWRAP